MYAPSGNSEFCFESLGKTKLAISLKSVRHYMTKIITFLLINKMIPPNGC